MRELGLNTYIKLQHTRRPTQVEKKKEEKRRANTTVRADKPITQTAGSVGLSLWETIFYSPPRSKVVPLTNSKKADFGRALVKPSASCFFVWM